MVLYFSGSGNSKYAAKVIAKETSDELVSINDLLKQKNAKEFTSEKPFVFVAPSYCCRFPRVVSNFIITHKFNGNKKAYFIMTAYELIGSAYKYNKKTATLADLEYCGTTSFNMPENYIMMYPTFPSSEGVKAASLIKDKLLIVAKDILSGKSITPPKDMTKSSYMSTIVNPIFYKMFVNAKGFYATDECVGCSKCVDECPLNNIHIKNNKPVWGNNCTHCTACINHCPSKAIEYKKNTQCKERYFLDI